MNGILFENTKIAAYFLWEKTRCSNAMNLWYCAEDIACFFERSGYLDKNSIDGILSFNSHCDIYINFMRHVAYRIYIYTECENDLVNWFAAEQLIKICEWTQALANMAAIYRNEGVKHTLLGEIRSDNVRSYYQTF